MSRKPRASQPVYLDPTGERTAADIMSVAHAEAMIAKLRSSVDHLHGKARIESRKLTRSEERALFYRHRGIDELKARIVELQALAN